MNNKKLNQLLWQYHRELKFMKNFSADTIKTYISCVNKYFGFAQSTFFINPIYSKAEHLFEFMIDLKKSISPSRQTHYRAALRRFFTLLFRLGEIDKNPTKNLLPIRRNKSVRYDYIPANIIFNLLSIIDTKTTIGRRDRLMILLLWCLGLRSGELRSLVKSDVKIIDQKKNIALVTINGKGAKQRALMAVDRLFDLLIEYIKPLNENDLLFPGRLVLSRVERLLPSPDERHTQNPMDNTSINKRIKKYAVKTNVSTRITAHNLRHCFATEMYYADVPLEALRTMLGHENLRESSVYIHVSEEDKTSALSLLSVKEKDYAA